MAHEEEDIKTLREVFSLYDRDGSGAVDTKELGAILEAIGKDPADAEEMLKDVDPDMSGKLTFLEFVDLLNSRGRGNLPEEGADEKVIEFLRVLDKYREQCEAEGNYLEAGRAAQQLTALRKQEAKRQEKSLKARQIAERQDVQIAHNIQFAEFNAAWDKYLEEYDQMAQEYIARMAERHAKQLEEFRVKLKEDLEKKPPKFSRELLDWRKRELLLARQKKYSEAQKIKRVADELEREERSRIDEERLKTFQQKEAKFRTQQQAELAALLKRIDGRRKEHLKQRELDSKRLLQRNRNVQAVLESKQNIEAVKKLADIKSSLAPSKYTSKKKDKEAILGSSSLRSSSKSLKKSKKSVSSSTSSHQDSREL